MEAFDFAVGLGASRSNLLDGGSCGVTGPVPQPGLVARTIVGDDSFTRDAVGVEPCNGSMPEPGRGDSLFVVEDLGVDDAGPVVERMNR